MLVFLLNESLIPINIMQMIVCELQKPSRFNLLCFFAIASAAPHCVHVVAHEEASQISTASRK